MTRTVRPASEPTARTITVDICTASHLHPSGIEAVYVSSGQKDGVIWGDWVRVHVPHGFVPDEGRQQ